MAIANPLSIEFGSFEVGGSTAYQILPSFVLEQSYPTLRLVFDVLITASDLEQLHTLSAALEAAFRKRLESGETLEIDLGGSKSTYAQGSTILNCEAQSTKSGNPDTDYGTARVYTVAVSGELPADDSTDNGLRDLQVLVERTPSRQHFVTMRGIYTATDQGTAQANYASGFDAIAENYLSAVKGAATFELVEESETWDRHGASGTPAPNTAPFFRQYVELLSNQDVGIRDAPEIRDHRFTFRNMSAYPGDAGGATRLRRVTGTFECAVDIDETTDLGTVIEDIVRPHVESEFQSEFDPQVFAVESFSGGRDRTGNRITATFEIIYQGPSDGIVVEATTALTYREQRVIDYTPTHGGGELEMFADRGWVMFQRTWRRRLVVLGNFGPRRRLTQSNGDGGLPGFSGGAAGDAPTNGTRLNANGWNMIESVSDAEPFLIGEPGRDAIEVTRLTETVTEQFHQQPGVR